MWELIKFLVIVFLSIIFLLSFSKSYFHFAVISELVWLSIFTILSFSGSYLNDIILLSLPFIILTLTAIEAVVIWSLILLRINLLIK